ncbi:MAG: hypothetical protein O2867_00590 [Bacteroidetes bacterium]|jgi:hypothetical protein|nr:hypothetical protein [Bacteroidota bacterium]
MNTLDYVSLNYDEKRELIRINGSFISEMQNESSGRRTIYALYGFFVEVFMDECGVERYIRVLKNCFDTRMSLEGIIINLN